MPIRGLKLQPRIAICHPRIHNPCLYDSHLRQPWPFVHVHTYIMYDVSCMYVPSCAGCHDIDNCDYQECAHTRLAEPGNWNGRRHLRIHSTVSRSVLIYSLCSPPNGCETMHTHMRRYAYGRFSFSHSSFSLWRQPKAWWCCYFRCLVNSWQSLRN
jgi:hypothetical protein